jgi:PKD repeat protein
MSVPSYSGPQIGGPAMAVDNSFPPNTPPNYSYRVIAANVVGDDYVYAGSVGFPTVSRNSTASGINSSQQIDPPLTASFTYIPASGDAPLNVTFTDTSTGTVTGWNWDFGDGNFASDNGKQNPSHVYELPGTYTVTLTAMNTGGSTVSDPSSVTVRKVQPPAAPVANFTATPTNGTAPLMVTFTDTSTSNPAAWATWRWSFGDGTFSSVENPVHTYTTGGNFTVNLTATNLGGTDVMSKVRYINVTVTNRTDEIGVSLNDGWWLDSNGNGRWDQGVDTYYSFGSAGVRPVTGDWNKDGKTEIGVSLNDGWWLDSNGNGRWDQGVDTYYSFGSAGVRPVTGDWNNNGITEIGVQLNDGWWLDSNGNGRWDQGVDTYYSFGSAGVRPVTGDWNNNGITEIGVQLNDGWWLDSNGNGRWDQGVDTYYSFGSAGVQPVTGKWG